MGNQQGYADIDQQRKSEMNYKFSLEELTKDTEEQERQFLEKATPTSINGDDDVDSSSAQTNVDVTDTTTSSQETATSSDADAEKP